MEFETIGQSLFDLFFPKRCVNCGSVLSENTPLCISCTSRLPFTHWHLDGQNAGFAKLRILCETEAAYSLLYFRHENVTQKLLHSLKYENRPEIGKLLGELALREINPAGYDGIIPVPIHPKKLKKRGYNQVVPFASTLAEKSGIPLTEDFLIRVENNPSQVFKNREKRLNSIQNAFSLTDKNLEGRFILIDDILTTGATISTCINLIHSKHPSLKISVMTIACAV